MSSPSWMAAAKAKLAQVGVHITGKDLRGITCGQVLDAEDWADAELAAAKDPAVQRKARPAWLPEATA